MSLNSTDENIKKLIAGLQSEDEADRRYAAEDIEEGGFSECTEALTICLKDKSIAVSEACASALIKVGGQEAARLIVPYLSTEEIHLRNITCEVLNGLGQDAIDSLMEQLQHKDRDVRKFAVDVLLEIGSPESVSGLIKALDDPDVNIAATAADGIGQVGSIEHVDLLAKYLDSDTWMKCAILRALGCFKGDDVFNKVRPSLDSEDLLEKITAIQSLGHIAHPRGFIPILQLLNEDNLALFGADAIKSLNSIVSEHPSYSFADLIEEKHLKVFAWVLQEAPIETKRRCANLAGFCSEEVVPLLAKAFEVEDEELHEIIVNSIRQIHPNNISALANILDSPNEGLMEKMNALRAIQATHHKHAPLIIGKSLNGTNEEKILAALAVLGPHTRPIPFDELKKLISHINPIIRINTVEAMGRLTKDEFAPYLISQLNREIDEEVKYAIDASLLAIGQSTENETLGVFLASFSPEERKRVSSYFGFHDPSHLLEKFEAGLSDENPEIREISYKVFANLKKATFELIETGLDDEVANVRVEAVRCLTSIKDVDQVLAFAEKIKNKLGSHERVKVELIQVLSAFQGREDASDLVMPFLQDSSPWVQIEAVEGLKQLDDVRAIEPLKDLLDSKNEDLLNAVYSALDELE
ncbi:MAG: HEAT repeat domain-containing protein [SAR324 cluster bacterium]|nr:HEAT repeat domain-containing protein [SAR324 cluster bacterium]